MNKEISVIGASAAGLFISLQLAKKDMDVKVYEAKKEKSADPRTLIVTTRIKRIMGPLYKETIINKINRFELFADGKVATIHLEKPDLVMERSRIIDILAEQCISNGVNIRNRHELTSLESSKSKIKIRISIFRV